MGVLRPATPGFLVTLTATVLLVVVVFCVPYFKSIYFLKASFSESGVNGEITLGTLGYCFTVNNVANCSSPSVGYEFDPNKLLGNDLPIQIPEVAVKWLTYALVLHVVALGFAAVATVFGLLAHVREMSMACCSSCFSGGAAAITLIAFIFDMVFFYVAKGRINKVQGGSATMGTAIWLTLAAWLLLFFAGCFYTVGRCCIGSRPDGPSRRTRRKDEEEFGGGKAMPGAYGGGGSGNGDRDDAYNTSLRMAAIKAEAERKALAASQQREQGLPAFEEYERTPLRQQEEEHYADVGPAAMGAAGAAAVAADVRRGPSGYSQGSRQPSEGHYPGGYASGAPGTRAMDNYYNPATSSNPAGSGYPPTSSYANAAPPAGAAPAASYSVGAVYGATPTRQQSGSYADRYAPQTDAYQDPYAAAGHQQQASYDPYAQHPTGNEYYNTPASHQPYDHQTSGYPTGPSSYYTANDQTPRATGAGNTYPPAPDRGDSSYFPHPSTTSPAPAHSSPAADAYGARLVPSSTSPAHDDGAYGGYHDPQSHYQSPTHTQPEPQDHDWQHVAGGGSQSDHHGGEALPEYNPYEEPGPSIPAALASGGPPRAGKI